MLAELMDHHMNVETGACTPDKCYVSSDGTNRLMDVGETFVLPDKPCVQYTCEVIQCATKTIDLSPLVNMGSVVWHIMFIYTGSVVWHIFFIYMGSVIFIAMQRTGVIANDIECAKKDCNNGAPVTYPDQCCPVCGKQNSLFIFKGCVSKFLRIQKRVNQIRPLNLDHGLNGRSVAGAVEEENKPE